MSRSSRVLLALVWLCLPAEAYAVSLLPGDLVVRGTTATDGPGLHRVDPVTGAATLIRAGVVPGFLAVGTDQSIYVAAGDEVSRIDATTGASSLVSSGGPMQSALSLVRRADGQLFALDRVAGPDRVSRVIRIDPTSGAQTIVAEGGLFTAFSSIDAAVDLALHPDGRLLVGQYGVGGFWVDLTTGLQTPLAIGGYLNDVELSPDGGWIYRVDTTQGESVHRIDSITLDETPIFDLEGDPSVLVEDVWYPYDAAVEADGRVVVAGDFLLDSAPRHLVRWNPADGSWNYLSFGSFDQVGVVPVPEPGAAALLALGISALAARRARARA